MLEAKKIITWPNELLTQALAPVTEVTEEVKDTAKELTKSLILTMGLGITANQIGSKLSMFAMWKGDSILIAINPEIVNVHGIVETKKEGCLSLPNVQVKVPRHQRIDVKYMKLDGEIVEESLTEQNARVFQHETDHTKGVMIFDHVPNIIKKFTLSDYYKRNK